MNYYNPYYSMYPYMSAAKPGLFSRIFGGLKGIKFGSILSGTQKTLGIVNQTIPLVKQGAPILKNAKTMFRVMNEFKKVDTPKANKNTNININKNVKEDLNNYVEQTKLDEGPTFFL